MHGIGLLSVAKTDSANFPSDFNLPIVIFLLDYPNSFLLEFDCLPSCAELPGGIDESAATGLCQSEEFIRANPVRQTGWDP